VHVGKRIVFGFIYLENTGIGNIFSNGKYGKTHIVGTIVLVNIGID
jgi:hypothetical protein